MLRILPKSRGFLLLLFGFLLTAGSSRLNAAPSEFELKAAFIYNFTQYVQWPPEAFAKPGSPLVVAVASGEGFAVLRETLGTKAIGTHPIEIRRLEPGSDLHGVQVLYVNTTDEKRIGELLALARQRPVLTIGEKPGFAAEGGILNFVVEDSHLRFEINRQAALRVRLAISSRLLRLGILVGEPASSSLSDFDDNDPYTAVAKGGRR